MVQEARSPSYHRAARGLERLAVLVSEAASAEERMADTEARLKGNGLLVSHALKS